MRIYYFIFYKNKIIKIKKMENKDQIEDEKQENSEKNDTSENAENLDYEILMEDFSYFDLSFKVIVIGDSGNIKLYFI